MANIIALGKVTVPAPGTPIRFTTLKAGKGVTLQAHPGNSGLIYVGVAGMNKTTLAGCIRVMQPGDGFAPWGGDGGNQLVPSEIHIDADNANDSVIGGLLEG